MEDVLEEANPPSAFPSQNNSLDIPSFCQIFKRGNENILKHFLQTFLGFELQRLRILSQYEVIDEDLSSSKLEILEVYCQNEEGFDCFIQIQKFNDAKFNEKMAYHECQFFLKKLKESSSQNELEKYYTLRILGFLELGNEGIIVKDHPRDEEKNIISNLQTFISIYLSRFSGELDDNLISRDQKKNMVDWLHFLRGEYSQEKISKCAAEIQQAYNIIFKQGDEIKEEPEVIMIEDEEKSPEEKLEELQKEIRQEIELLGKEMGIERMDSVGVLEETPMFEISEDEEEKNEEKFMEDIAEETRKQEPRDMYLEKATWKTVQKVVRSQDYKFWTNGRKIRGTLGPVLVEDGRNSFNLFRKPTFKKLKVGSKRIQS